MYDKTAIDEIKSQQAVNNECVHVLRRYYTYPYGVANVGSGENSKVADLSLLEVVDG